MKKMPLLLNCGGFKMKITEKCFWLECAPDEAREIRAWIGHNTGPDNFRMRYIDDDYDVDENDIPLINGLIVHFENIEDAVAFKLRWS